MNFWEDSPEFLNVARRYQADMEIAAAYMKESDIQGRLNNKGVEVDTRDFLPMILLMGIEGATEDERTKDIHQKLEKLADAFSDPDKSSRDDYLNLIYYMVDDFANDFDPVTMNMGDPAAVEKLLQSMLISQTITTKKKENPDYYNAKYPTPQARNLADACSRFIIAIGSTIATNLAKNNIFIKTILSLPTPLPENMVELQHLREKYEKGLLEEAKATKGFLQETKTVDFPILDTLIPYCGKNVADIPKFSRAANDLLGNYYISMVQNTMLHDGSQNTLGMKTAGIGEVKEAVYIDGRPFLDFVGDRYPNGTTNGMINVIAATCILGGKHKVDIVNAYPNEAGVMQYEAKTVRFTVTPDQEKLYMQQFSWIRRNWFNWGPFRIETLQEKLDRIANDPEADARRASVIEEHKARIANAMARKRENEIQSQNNDVQKEQNRMSYVDAKDSLEASVTQWDKNSVIGILGQQITADYVINGVKMTGACDAIRKAIASSDPPQKYAAMAPLFAKVLLYSQLRNERTANNGEPGEMEKLLGTGNSIQENIENITQEMVNDPVFQNLVLKKMGSVEGRTVGLQRGKFQDIIASGGCVSFWQEYKQNKKEMGSKEQYASTIENQMENEKQKDAPHL